MSHPETASISSYEKVEEKKKEIAKRLANKSDVLKKVAKKYRPKEQKAECSLARDVFYEALEEYEEGQYTWEKFVSEVNKSLLAIKK